MKIFYSSLILSAFAVFTPIGLSQGSVTCPTVWINGPTSDSAANEPLVFTARVTRLNPTAQPKFRWEISAGTILSGQGTPSVTIDTTGLGGVTVTAKVIVEGMATDCPKGASRSASILPLGIACGLPFDTYGDISIDDEEARLDNFAIQVLNDETSTGYILFYAGRSSYEEEGTERLKRAKEYLVRKREMPPERIITIDGGYREDFTIILIVAPSKANPPVAMPSLSPPEIELTKPRPKSPAKRPRTNPY
ncbi:MAG TPA: hypothetical protein VFH31_17900 [Pyrinomonadaceae bacterium]|nr:hypothetical protein [Pyrinomonadaceae bacterium]